MKQNLIYKLRSGKQTVAFSVMFVVLLALVVIPFIILALKSFGISMTGSSVTSLDFYRRCLSDKNFIHAATNTLLISTLTMTIALIRAFVSSWLVTRTDFAHKQFVKMTAFLTFTIPSYILGVSYLELTARGGFIHHFVETFWNVEYSFNPYSIGAVVLVMSVHLYPFCFFAISHAMEKCDNSLEDAAIVSGASRKRAIATITIPLLAPTLCSIGLFVFSRSMANFGVPSILLMPAFQETLSTKIYKSLALLDLNLLAAQSMVLVLMSVAIFMFQDFLISRKNFVTISTHASAPRLQKLKHSRLITIFVIVVETLLCIVPIVVVFASSLLKRWGIAFRPENLTLGNYQDLFSSDVAVRAFANSFMYGLVAALIACAIASGIVFYTNTSRFKHAGILEAIASWPMSFPNIVMAIAAILTWSQNPFNFYATPWIIIITYTALFLPIALKNVSGGVKNLDFELVNAARAAGATASRAMKDVVLPTIKPALTSALILCMLIAFREIPISLMLHTSGTETVGVLLFNMKSNSSGLEATSTIASVVIIISLIGRLLVKSFSKGKKKHASMRNSKSS